MATEMKVPALGEGVEGGKVLTIEIAVGDSVTEGQSLFELETGKATVEVPASADGVIEELTISEGDELSVGDAFGTLSGGEAPAEEDTSETPSDESDPSDPSAESEAEEEESSEEEVEEDSSESSEISIEVPALGEGVEGGTVVSIAVSAGDDVTDGQTLFELETGKATVEVPAPAAGTLSSLSVEEGAELKVGDTIGSMMGKGSAPRKSKKSKPAKKKTDQSQTQPQKTAKAAPADAAAPKAPLKAAAARPENSPVPASPSVRKFAREIGVDIHEVPGTGPRDRIQMLDVKAWSKQLHQQRGSVAGGAPAAPAKKVPLPDFSTFGEIEKEKMNAIRRMTVEHMDNCWSTIPHVTQFDDADVTDLEALRKSFQPKAEKAGTKLTMTAMLIKIMGSALKAFPNFNASLDIENEEIIFKKYINVGCAVDTPKGLVVPVIRGVDGLNMIEISKELGDMAGSMRDGKINPAMLQGGCITLSNLGGLSGKHFTPIVNGPEVAILGVGRASMKPVWQNGEFVPRLMMPLSLSYDHRLIDGADGTRFLRWIVDAIEQPLLISLEG